MKLMLNDSMIEEIWKECHLSPNYKISNMGNVFSIINNRNLNKAITNNMYQVILKINKKQKFCKVHRLVCFAFDPNFDNGVVKFKNGNTLDCRFENLEYNIKDVVQNEIWKTCNGYDKYSVSDFGRIKNNKSGRILKLTLSKNGYHRVILIQKTPGISVHRLVLNSFKQDEYFEGAVCNHINGIKTDNRLENLEWCTSKENTQHALKNSFIPLGEDVKHSKLSELDVKRIRELHEQKHTRAEIARKYKLSFTTVTKIVNRISWKHI